MPRNHTSGQILVLVLLVVLIGMSIGLSIASRTLSNLKDTTALNQSNRAFSAAEAGIEHALSNLASCSTDNAGCSAAVQNNVSGIDGVAVKTQAIGGSATKGYGLPSLGRDNVMQVNLDTYSGTTLDVYWGSSSDSCANNGANTAAVVVSLVYLNGSTYDMTKYAYDACATSRSNGFNSASVSVPTGSIAVQNGSMSNFASKATVTLPSGVKIARIRLMYGDDTEQIAAMPVGAALPPQGTQITSTAKAGNTQRTVTVVRSNSSLPAIFDYALFNGSTQPLSK